MRSTRAYVASIGASISLIAAAALTLLTVSAVVALEGWPGIGATSDEPALIVGDTVLADAGERPASPQDPEPVVLREPRSAAVASEPAARTERPGPAPSRVDAQRASEPASVREAPPTSSTPELDTSTSRPAPVEQPRPRPDAPTIAPNNGEVVRSLGDTVNSTVQSTGTSLQELAAPLSPQAGAALKDLASLLGILLQKTTGTLGNVLDQVGSAPR